MPRTKKLTPVTLDNPVIAGPRAPADRLYRAACECVRQRQRYAALVENGTGEEEQIAALEIASICDAVLLASIGAYESTGTAGAVKEEEWYRKAVMLWQASREYQRRHAGADLKSRTLTSHSPEQLKQLTMEYDLEASALLALQHALTAYRKCVPEAHIEATSSRLP
jgi:uncharacterized protein YeaC (DUF1315 family)